MVEFGWNARKDLHRAGLIWGYIDSNLTNVTNTQNSGLTTEDMMAGKFFFGFSASKLGKHWNRSIIDLVKQDPFDYESIVYYLSIINDNIYDRSYIDWYYAVYNIYYILDDTIGTLFPGDVVPENYTNIYEHLNNTRFLYSDLDTFSSLVDNVKDSVNLTDFIGRKVMGSMTRDNSSTGFLWGKFNEIIRNGSFNLTKRENQEFLKGILGREITKDIEVLGILDELNNIKENRKDKETVKKSIFKIASIVQAVIDEMFPLVGYGYRYGFEMRVIPEEFQEVYDRLQRIRKISSDFRGVKGFLKDNKRILKRMLGEILETKSYYVKGQKFASMSEFIAKNAKREPEFLGL